MGEQGELQPPLTTSRPGAGLVRAMRNAAPFAGQPNLHNRGGFSFAQNAEERFPMPEDEIDATVDATEDEETEVDETADEEVDEPLGEAGKKALATERAAARAAKREARDAKSELEALKAQIAAKDKPADEQELDRVRREASLEASRNANQRILRSEIRAAAAGKFADPADAVLFLDLNEFEVTDDGSVDSGAIEDAISELLTRKPHLAASGKKFGNVNQSPKAPAKPGQLSLSEYNALSREDRRKAREDGRVANLIGAK